MDTEIHKTWSYHKEHNAEDKSCGDLTMSLFKFFKTVDPGETVFVTAYSMGIKYDIYAWCRTTNKELLEVEPPYFLIKKN